MSQSIAIGSVPASAPAKAYPDWIGVAASLLCAIHCAAMPFVVGFLPLLGLSFLADPSFHQWMVAVCLALAAAPQRSPAWPCALAESPLARPRATCCSRPHDGRCS